MPNRKAGCVVCVLKKPDMQDMQKGTCPKKKKESVDSQFFFFSSIGQKRMDGLKN